MFAANARISWVTIFLAIAAMVAGTAPTFAQGKDEAEEGRLKTADGLRLNYLWYAGGKGQKSDSVILVPTYGYDSTKSPTKGQWSTLAKALQKEGYSVLMFDFRGFGKSADFKTMAKPEDFCLNSYNRYSGQTLNPNTIKEIRREKFSPNYYPYLVNDLTAARRFVDEQNDAQQCNSGRIFVVAERDSCPLVMLWAATEFGRYGFGPKTKLDDPDKIPAGEDLSGIVFLSWQGAQMPGAGTALKTARTVMADKELGSQGTSNVSLIGNQMKKKVAMAFIYGKEDRSAAQEARTWFTTFGLPPTAKEDKETVKYIREIPGAEKLTGIQLLDIMEKPKDTGEKVSLLEGQIIEFFKATKTKSINGNNWKERKMENLDAVPVPLDFWGLKAPK